MNKTISFIFNRTVYQCIGSQSCDESKSGNITDFVDSLCFKSSFSTDTWKLYDHFQHFTYRTADPDPEEKF